MTLVAAALTLASGCGVVSKNGITANGEGGAVSDAPSNEGSFGASDASSCEPADVETYHPSAYRPATAAWQGVCTAMQIADFYNACLVPNADPADCHTFSDTDAATSACAACILTPESAAAYGPLVNHGTFITSNVAGCIQLTLPSQLSCAKAEEALAGCEVAACEANCPVHDATTRAAYDSCAAQADGAGCQSYAQMAACAQSLAQQDASAAAACEPPSFKDFYDAVVPLFCAVPSQDAGAILVDSSAPGEGGSDSGEPEGAVPDARPVDAAPN